MPRTAAGAERLRAQFGFLALALALAARELLAQMLERLGEHLSRKKLNRSEVREKILETIVFEARHFRAQELLDRVKNRYPDIGKATLYRNLPVLVESGVLQEGPTDDSGQATYELADGEQPRRRRLVGDA